jgi:WD domain, G-beta repeat
MKSWVLRGLFVGFLLVSLTAPLLAVTFDSDATVSDRQVDLFWQPDEDDPVFTGNLKMFPLGETNVSTGPLEYPVFISGGSMLYLWDVNNRQFIQMTLNNGDWEISRTFSPVPGDAQLLSVAVHPVGVLVMAGFSDGKLYAWRPNSEIEGYTEHQIHDSGVSALEFPPLATAIDSTFISTGRDGYWKKWSRPGALPDFNLEAFEDGTPIHSLKIIRAGNRFAVGGEQGHVKTFSLADATSLMEIDADEDTGESPINSLRYSEDGKRLAVADESGYVRIFDTIGGSLKGVYTPPAESPVYISYTPRESDYIGYAHANGTFGILNGNTCQPFDIVEDMGETITGFTLYVSGLRGFFLTEDGKLKWWYQGECIPSEDTPECFGGYEIRRQEFVDTVLVALRVYNYADTTWGWTPSDTTRFFVDPDSIIPYGGEEDRVAAGPHNGIPYYYSLIKYYWHFRPGGKFKVYEKDNSEAHAIIGGLFVPDGATEPQPLTPRVDAVVTQPVLENVYVVPNPYRSDRDDSIFDISNPEAIKFFNLPERATIRIFTVNGELVKTLNHPEYDSAISGGECRWNLRNEDDNKVASGVYVYAIELDDGQGTNGFFTLIF